MLARWVFRLDTLVLPKPIVDLYRHRCKIIAFYNVWDALNKVYMYGGNFISTVQLLLNSGAHIDQIKDVDDIPLDFLKNRHFSSLNTVLKM